MIINQYIRVVCPHCGSARAVAPGTKEFQCFTCGRRSPVEGHEEKGPVTVKDYTHGAGFVPASQIKRERFT